MCGRFTLTNPVDELAGYFDVIATTAMAPRYNVAPTQPVACVRRRLDFASAAGSDDNSDEERRRDAGGRELVPMRWGLIPAWAKDAGIGARMINARAETVAEKPAYKEAFRKRRCLVLADGFYEWKRLEGGKQPYYIYLQDRRPFAFAGLWERWRPRDGQLDKITAPGKPQVPVADGRVESCSFLTIGPNALMEEIHDRMPVILPADCWQAWLDPENDDVDGLQELLLPYPAEEMQAHPVSTHVNKPVHDDPRCIEPIKTLKIVRPEDEEPEQSTLF